MHSYIVRDINYYCNRSVSSCKELTEIKLDYFDFTFVLNGSMTYYVNKKKLTLRSGDAIFLRPNDIRYRKAGTTPVHYVSFNFNTDHSTEIPFEHIIKNCINEDIKKLISIYQPRYLIDRFHAKEKCKNILNYILLELYDMHKLQSKNSHIMNIIKFIDDHITENISLKEISEYCHLSREYTSYIFKRETGKQLVAYINEQKSLLAKKIILNENMSLTELSNYLGFENYDYFSKTFKRYIGITPLKLLKNVKRR
jgi:YesN/AraC family two-component response regulator